MIDLKRRANDLEMVDLIRIVEALDNDVKKLRTDFEDHVLNEGLKIEMLNASLVTIQVKLDQLLVEIKEPMEAYKTAKYGVSFLKYIADTAKWAVPLIIGSMIGYGALTAIQQKIPEPTPTTITQGK